MIAAIIAVFAGALLLFGIGGTVLAIYLVRARDSASMVNSIVNSTFDVSGQQATTFKVTLPPNAHNARIVGGFKVVSGSSVGFYIVSEAQFAQWSSGFRKLAMMTRENTDSLKIRQPLTAGTYYVCFVGSYPSASVRVAAELYAKYD